MTNRVVFAPGKQLDYWVMDEVAEFPQEAYREPMTKFRTGRIWRLGEKELVVRKYVAPSTLELWDALEDSEPTPAAIARFQQGLGASQLTSTKWHQFWRSL